MAELIRLHSLSLDLRNEIAERERTEQALRASEQRFRDFAATASDWFWEMDAELRFSWFSDRYQHQTGEGVSTRLGKRRDEVGLHDPGDDDWDAHLADLAARRPFRDFVYAYKDCDGVRRFASTSGTPIFDPSGRFRGYRGSARDVTARRQAEQALRDSEERYRRLVEASPDGIIIVQRGRITFANVRAIDLLGAADRTALLGQAALRFTLPTLRTQLKARAGRLLKGSEIETVETVVRCLDGTLIEVEAFATLVSIGGIDSVQLVLRDISARKRAEAERARLAAVLEATSDMVGMCTPDFRAVYLNQSGRRMLGIAPDGPIVLDRQRKSTPPGRGARSPRRPCRKRCRVAAGMARRRSPVRTARRFRYLRSCSRIGTAAASWRFFRRSRATSPSANAPRSRSAIWRITIRSRVCRTAGCSRTGSSRLWRLPRREVHQVGVMIVDLDLRPAPLDLDEVLKIVLGAMDRVLGFTHSMILVPDLGQAVLHVAATHGYAGGDAAAQVRFGEGVIGVVAERRKMMRMGNIGASVRYLRTARAQMGAAGTLGPAEAAAALPGLPDAQSQLAPPSRPRTGWSGSWSWRARRSTPSKSWTRCCAHRGEPGGHGHRQRPRLPDRRAARTPQAILFAPAGRSHHQRGRRRSPQDAPARGHGRLPRPPRLHGLRGGLGPRGGHGGSARIPAEMGQLILDHEGTLERFTGDGMMIFFNDPLIVPNPAERALRMAVAMRDRAVALAARWRRRGYDLDLGIGIAKGFATIGAIGFEGRWDYGAIGTVTNLAARLCGEAKPGQILIAPRVLAEVEELVEVDEVGPLTLKGFSRPVAPLNVVRLRENP